MSELLQTECFVCHDKLEIPFEGETCATCRRCYEWMKGGSVCASCGVNGIFYHDGGICMDCIWKYVFKDDYNKWSKIRLHSYHTRKVDKCILCNEGNSLK